MSEILIARGFYDAERPEIAALFWGAFRNKLRLLLRPEDKALAFIAAVLDPEHAICARSETGALLGVAGFKTARGALVGGGFRELAAHFGAFGALWRGLFLEMLEREPDAGVLLMDGIFVTEAARGRGIGTALLAAVGEHARAEGCGSVRLDVIDTNPRARALYLREGFEPGPKTDLGPLRHVFGFSSSEEMRLTL